MRLVRGSLRPRQSDQKNVPSRIGRVSDDAYKGDAQYEVLVDGTQIGGIQTAHASHAVGQSGHLVVQGNWGSGTHGAAVVFLNDAYDGTPTTDRNLYIDGATYNGVDVNGAKHAQMGTGAFHFNVGAPASSTAPPSNALAPVDTTAPGGMTATGAAIGSGPISSYLPRQIPALTSPQHVPVLIGEPPPYDGRGGSKTQIPPGPVARRRRQS